MDYQIRELGLADREWVARFIAEQWGSRKLATRGKLYDAEEFAGFAAFENDKFVGLLTFRKHNDEIEIMSLNIARTRSSIASGRIHQLYPANNT